MSRQSSGASMYRRNRRPDENLDLLDRELVVLEKDPQNKDALSNVFHTIKGTCGFLGFSKLESAAHVGENLLSRLRDGRCS